MQIKIGTWAGGDPSNSQGTISWAGGETDYADGPFVGYIKSVSVQDYSTGSSYYYSGNSGTWESIQSNGGTVNPDGGSSSMSSSSGPSTTQVTSGQPSPFEGTQASSSPYTTPSIYPCVVTGSGSETTSSAHAGTSVHGLPSGWSVSGSSYAVPSSSAGVSTTLLSLSPCFFLLFTRS